MATSPDGPVLPPVTKAVSLCTPVAGEHGQEGAVAPVPCLWVPGQQPLCERSAGLDRPLV